MTSYLSDKLRVLSFVSILLVLFIHSSFRASEISHIAFAGDLQHLISDCFGRLAVPLFYCISGYLFFLKMPTDMNGLFLKMRTRVRTLVIPYLIGCSFFPILFFALSLIPFAATNINSDVHEMFHKSICKLLWDIFISADNGSPMAFQLWFLRDLIIYVALSPLIWFGLRWRHGLGLVSLLFLSASFGFVRPGLMWFVLGGSLAGTEIALRRLPKSAGILGALYFLLSTCEVFTSINFSKSLPLAVIAFGILSLWTMYDALVPAHFKLAQHPQLATACGFTFFIYLFHEPTISIPRKLIVIALGRTPAAYITSYCVSPFLFALIALLIGLAFRTYAPRLYAICTGGRGLASTK